MKPDHDLREIIATKLMGFVYVDSQNMLTPTKYLVPADAKGWVEGKGLYRNVPEFELEIAAAFQAVEAMVRKGYRFSLDNRDGNWHAHFTKRSPIRPMPIKAIHEHPPTAIALAIVAALESEEA